MISSQSILGCLEDVWQEEESLCGKGRWVLLKKMVGWKGKPEHGERKGNGLRIPRRRLGGNQGSRGVCWRTFVTKWPETATACMCAVWASWGSSADMSSSNWHLKIRTSYLNMQISCFPEILGEWGRLAVLCLCSPAATANCSSEAAVLWSLERRGEFLGFQLPKGLLSSFPLC